MSLTQSYYVASTARSKLGREASRGDHNLRRLVGHANLLDNLMIELQDAERQQESWFNQSIRSSSKADEPRRVQWVDTIAEEEYGDDESDSDSDMDEEEDAEMFDIPLRRVKSPPVISSAELEDEDVDADFDEDYEEALALTRTPSNKHSPPELTHDDSDSDEDEDEVPTSPENITLELSEKQKAALATTSLFDLKAQQGLEDYVMGRSQAQAPYIAAAC